MTTLPAAVDTVLAAQVASGKPLAIVLAGHNGSGKSTMWYEHLAPTLQIPLINADRMMMSILPEVPAGDRLPAWAATLRDRDGSWMGVAQKGVEAFVAQAIGRRVPFAMETVFSHWQERADGSVASKLDLIVEMQAANYFVVLFFVGLTSVQLSTARVSTRVQRGGHAVDEAKLVERFPRTQRAVGRAAPVADATIFTDNSRSPAEAFTVCRIQMREQETYDLRALESPVPAPIARWLDVVCPR